MIRFLFGRPGSGKTRYTVESIRRLTAEGRGQVYLIVPEQQAYTTERELLSALPPEATQHFTVLSFTRLCDTLFELYGGRAHQTVTRAMRSLLMWENLRELGGLLETYGGGTTTDPSLCRKMLSATQELAVSGITPTALENAADRLPADSPLRAKLRDIALVSASYTGLMTEVYGEDPADRLLRAAEKLEEHDFFKGAYVFLDSFTSFTAQEYAILRPILTQAAEVTVTFCCSDRYDPRPQLDSTRDAIRRLTLLCEDAGVDMVDTVVEGSFRTDSPSLQRLERHLWDFDFSPESAEPIPGEDHDRVRLYVAPSLYDEAKSVALHVLEAVEQGVPYSAIAVVVRDLPTWEGVLDAALEQYGIPYFLSERVDLNRKPAARLLLTALRCVAKGWQIEDILTLCKTGLLPLTLREIDAFAEYTDTWRLTGRRMTDESWSMNPDGYRVGLSARGREILVAANKVRETVMLPLLSLKTKLKGAVDVTEQCRALYEYLVEVSLKESLMKQAETQLSLGHTREAGELLRLWSFITETLATVASVMKESEPLTPDQLCTALTLVFADTDIGSVPARHDCITVGDAATLRVDRIHTLLVAGLCEGDFPRSITEDGLLSEQDKAILADLGVKLDSRDLRLTSDELLYVWRSFSKPSDTLILSYSSTTPDGQSRSPSSAVSRARYLLPHLKPIPFSAALLMEEEGHPFVTPVADALPRPAVRKLLGEEIWLSQSRLLTYARCPYSYYGSHVLSLREKSEAKFDNLNAGNFLHHVMEQYLRRALDGENRLVPLSPAEAEAVADAIISAYVAELCGDVSVQGRLLRLFDRLRAVALMLIDTVQEELSAGRFEVAGLEWDTHGYRPGDPKPMRLTLNPADREGPALPTRTDGAEPNGENPDHPDPDGLLPLRNAPAAAKAFTEDEDGIEGPVTLLLGGRIDRVDLYRAEDGETVYIRVVDYKSSPHDFRVRSVTEEMNIQLLLYLFTLCSPQNRSLFATADGRLPTRVLPASLVYVSPKESDRDGTLLPRRSGVVLDTPEITAAVGTPSDPAETFLPSVTRTKTGKLSGTGLYSPERMAELEGILHAAITDTAARMYGGCATRTPSPDTCRYCPLRGSCGISEAEG